MDVLYIQKELASKNITIKKLHAIITKFKLPVSKNQRKSALMYSIYSIIENTYKICGFGIKGRRNYMEDRYVFIQTPKYILSQIFDGHGGKRCSAYMASNFFKHFSKIMIINNYNVKRSLLQTINKLNNIFINSSYYDGTTANIIFIDKNNKILYNLNIGDSRSIIGKARSVVEISKDHKPNNKAEKRWIERNGGFVKGNRINGILAMSRSLGDKQLRQYINYSPDLFSTKLTNFKFILHATDGLFDVMTNKQVYSFVMARLKKKYTCSKIIKELISAAYVKGSSDNISVILIFK